MTLFAMILDGCFSSNCAQQQSNPACRNLENSGSFASGSDSASMPTFVSSAHCVVDLVLGRRRHLQKNHFSDRARPLLICLAAACARGCLHLRTRIHFFGVRSLSKNEFCAPTSAPTMDDRVFPPPSGKGSSDGSPAAFPVRFCWCSPGVASVAWIRRSIDDRRSFGLGAGSPSHPC